MNITETRLPGFASSDCAFLHMYLGELAQDNFGVGHVITVLTKHRSDNSLIICIFAGRVTPFKRHVLRIVRGDSWTSI